MFSPKLTFLDGKRETLKICIIKCKTLKRKLIFFSAKFSVANKVNKVSACQDS